MRQALLAQLALACATPQMLPQAPQLLTSLVVLVSQPLAALPSQLAQPALHEPMAQALPTQVEVACAALHTLPQELQLLTSLVVLTSQPLVALPSQLAKPAEQAMEHELPEQVGVPPFQLPPEPHPPQL